MELVKGRPVSTKGRLDKELRVYDLLDQLNIEFQRVDHEALFTMEACVEVDKILECTICKNLFLCNRKKTQFYLLMMVGEKRFDPHEIQRQLSLPRLSFANPSYMEEYLDITPGSMSVFGLMNDHENKVRLLVDEDVFKGDYIGAHPCINTSSLKLKTKDLFGPILAAMNHEYTLVKIGEEI